MIVIRTREDLDRLILDCVEEGQQLEYKGAKALQNRDALKDIAKDVSAMANASGGVIVYGIQEHDSHDKRHLPESITPIRREQFSKERLEQIINSNISPRIDGIFIQPIPLEKPNEVCYVVEVPQSLTAHQSLKDFIYYRRLNFEVLPMQDYEIRDVMNRIKYPNIEISFRIKKTTHFNQTVNRFGGSGQRVPAIKDEQYTSLTLNVMLSNIGNQFALYVNYYLEIPLEILAEIEVGNKTRLPNNYVRFYGENTYRDLLDTVFTVHGTETKYGPSRFDPILPGLKGRPTSISLKPEAIMDSREIKWHVYADNAPKKYGVTLLREISTIETENDFLI